MSQERDTTIPKNVLGELRQKVANWKKSPSYQKIVDAKDGVLERFQPVFSPEHIPEITEEEFRPFLLDEINRHWTGLYRQGPRICSDMAALRNALTLLLDKSRPLAERLDKATDMISGMGKNIASAILLVAYPNDYGVWNNQSEATMKQLGIWPKFVHGESFGEKYAKVNDVLLQLRDELVIDLWALDYLWWYLDQEEPTEPPPLGGDEEATVDVLAQNRQRFGLEKHLHEFLRDNWEHTELGRDWELYGEQGDEDPGYEYPTDVGRIDLLAKHRTKKSWLVVELKRNQSSDRTAGQLLRYIGWVKQHLAEDNEEVRGMIICREPDASLYYALSIVPNTEIRLYEVEFRLKNDNQVLGDTRDAE